MFLTFDNVFHVYSMRGFQKYERNWIFMMAFWVTCKIAQPIQPIWQHIFALPWSALKKPSWEFKFFHIFGISSSSRHEKCCQMLERLFVLFHHYRNISCIKTNICWQNIMLASKKRREADSINSLNKTKIISYILDIDWDVYMWWWIQQS